MVMASPIKVNWYHYPSTVSLKSLPVIINDSTMKTQEWTKQTMETVAKDRSSLLQLDPYRELGFIPQSKGKKRKVKTTAD